MTGTGTAGTIVSAGTGTAGTTVSAGTGTTINAGSGTTWSQSQLLKPKVSVTVKLFYLVQRCFFFTEIHMKEI